jgi:hypothetical protein
VVDRELEPRSGHTKDYKIGICCWCNDIDMLILDISPATRDYFRRRFHDRTIAVTFVIDVIPVCLEVYCIFSHQYM